MLANLRNGNGLIYITDPANNILGHELNTCEGVRRARLQGAIVSSLAGEILATGRVIIAAALAGNVTGVNVNGINQLTSATVAITPVDADATAIDVANDINASAPAAGPRYTATPDNGDVLLTAPVGSGDTLNGDIVAAVFTGASTITTENISGGSSGGGVIDTSCGYKFWLDSAVAAPYNSIAGATEITNFLVLKGLQTSMDIQRLTISVGTLTPDRISQSTHLIVDTEAAAAADFLDFIDTTGWQEGDRMLISGADSTHSVQLRDRSVSAGNIELSNNNQFDTATREFNIELVLLIDAVNGPTWYEVTRSPAIDVDADTFLDLGLPLEVGFDTVAILAAGGTQNFDVATPTLSNTHLQLTTAGVVVLVGNYTVGTAGAPTDGQTLVVEYNGNITLGGNVLNILGEVISQAEATSGGIIIVAKYSTTLGTFQTTKLYNHKVAGLIKHLDLAADAVERDNILDGEIITIKLDQTGGSEAVITAAIRALAVTNPKLAAAAVDISKRIATLNEEPMMLSVSFETGELGEYRFYPAFKCQLTQIISRTHLLIEATDNATVQAANNTGNMANGLVTHVGAAAFGDEQSVSPTTNNVAGPGLGDDHFKFTSAKATPGGKTQLILFLTRVT